MFNIDSNTMQLLVWFVNNAKIDSCGLGDAEKIIALKKCIEESLKAAQQISAPVVAPEAPAAA